MTLPRYILRTDRLGMRQYTLADLDALREIFSDSYAAQFYPAMQETEALERWIKWSMENYENYGFGLWALELIETGRFIGDAGITYQTVEERKPLEIGYHIHPLLRGLGYATEAAHACVEWGFLNLGADFICSIVDPANAASIKVASRVHASQRGFKGKKGPMLLFNTTAEQYKARPSFVYRKAALAVDKNKP